jgi:outer membrane receptor protein involved in Fe transport
VIGEVSPGECVVSASKAGLETSPVAVMAVAGSGPPPIVLQLESGRFSEQVVVTPSRGWSERVSRVPESVTVTTRDDLDRRPHTLLGQALREQPGVMLQQTTTAQVSPVIRGFTGQSNVYLIDGVRLNASTWRSGPSQYLAWVDSHAIGGLEVVRGSGSLQYGSDALGGTLQLFPARPALRTDAGTVASGRIDVTAASSDRMAGLHAMAAIESSRVSASVGIDASSVGDLRAGGGGDSHAAVTRFLGLPASTPGNRMRGTGYDIRGGYAHGVARIGRAGVLSATYLTQQQTGVNRYDRLDGADGLHQSGFEPQRLDLAFVRYEASSLGPLDRWSAAVSLNRQEDGRFERARPAARLDRQSSITRAFGYQAQGDRYWGGRHQLLAGVERYDETISAERTLVELNGVSSQARPDVPDGTTYGTTGVFAQQISEVWRDRLWVRGGLRYSRFAFATVANPALGVVNERVGADALTFQAGSVLALTPYLNATFNVSRGFRAGNAADLGGIGLTGGGGFEISPGRARELGAFIGSNEGTTAVSTGQPVGSLAPEIADTFELALKFHGPRLNASVAVYDMELRDTIQRRTIIVDTSVVGAEIAGFVVARQDSQGRVFIAEDSRPLVTRVNLERARIHGVDAEASLRAGDSWSAAAYFSLSNGRVIGGDYLRRMPPPIGGLSIRRTLANGRGWIEGSAGFARPQRRLNAGDVSDGRIGARRTPASIASYFNGTATDRGLVAGGRLVATGETLAEVQARVLGGQPALAMFPISPGFVSLGVRTGWTLPRGLSVIVIGENLTDRNFRWHGSGVDAPGRNVQVRIRYHYRRP